MFAGCEDEDSLLPINDGDLLIDVADATGCDWTRWSFSRFTISFLSYFSLLSRVFSNIFSCLSVLSFVFNFHHV